MKTNATFGNKREHVGGALRHAVPNGAAATVLEEYEASLAIARERFDEHAAVRALFHDPIDPVTLESFLISFAIIGVRMTEPVEGWIRRAGRRCGELGLEALAKALTAHAHQEAEHHLLMLADARFLVERWNKAGKPVLNVDALLALPPTPGVGAYDSVHESVISGPTPYAQLAIEYEIEMLSVAYGPRLLERCTGLLGEPILEGLSFLSDHVALDAGHTNFNRVQLARLLEGQPGFLSALRSCACGIGGVGRICDVSWRLHGVSSEEGFFMNRLAATRKPASAYKWHLVLPGTCAASNVSTLAGLSEFRGRILYADGRRPRFRKEDGRYADDDALDSTSFHVTARTDGNLVGYVRVRSMTDYSQSSLRLLVTRPQFEAALEEMQLTRNDCLEVSRWIVAPSARGTEIAATLVVSAWAIGRWVGKWRLLATVGTRDGQAAMLARFGGQVLRSVDAKFMAEYDDELVVLQFDLNDPPPRVATKLSAVGRLLNLPDTCLEQSERDRDALSASFPC
jgi:hypothetical protein